MKLELQVCYVYYTQYDIYIIYILCVEVAMTYFIVYERGGGHTVTYIYIYIALHSPFLLMKNRRIFRKKDKVVVSVSSALHIYM